jgi:hypothetical protein
MLLAKGESVMIRIFIGAVVAGLVQFIVGAIAWATPLGMLAFKALGDGPTADLQAALGRTLGPTGTGTYFIPSPQTAAGTAMLGTGPVALIHFNTLGFPPMSVTALLTGLILSVAMMWLIGSALSYVRDFATRFRVMVLFATGTVLYFLLAMPVFNEYLPWDWWIYLAATDFLAFVVGAYVMIRWFMPREATPAI